ncbi:MAG: FHA domain-containing protein [Pseudomonadota bacterium]|nr:MAG: hypothetical protein DIU78_05590 [Pseudomonadota bacterium]
METLEKYRAAAAKATRAEFVEEFAGLYLLKRPTKGGEVQQPSTKIGFATTLAQIGIDPLASEWRIVPVRKRPDNPFPERLSIGRATNCDLVLRLPFVSKVQAHFVQQPDGSFVLRNKEPSNPTFHNHRKLEPNASRPLTVGDMVGFGPLVFEFVDAARLYDVLKRET